MSAEAAPTAQAEPVAATEPIEAPAVTTSPVPRAKHLGPTEINIKRVLHTEASQALVMASLACGPGKWQIAVPPLEKFSRCELMEQWKEYMDGTGLGKIAPFEPRNIESCVAFESDEDFAILNAIKNGTSFDEMMADFGFVFKAFRSLESIIRRHEEVKEWGDDKMNEFVEAYANEAVVEAMFDLSTREGTAIDQNILGMCRCAYRAEHPIVPTEESAEETARLMGGIQGPAFDYESLRRVLALLRSEMHEYHMKREAILIGRGTLTPGVAQSVDVDLTFEMDRTCTHISRAQAILSFMEDCNFYIENVGNRGFRVNGVLIPPGGICQLKSGAILDFSGALLMFIPNRALVAEISLALEGSSNRRR